MNSTSFNCFLHQCFATDAHYSLMQLDILFMMRFEWKIECVVEEKNNNNENVKCNYGNMLLSSYFIRIDNPTASSLKYA